MNAIIRAMMQHVGKSNLGRAIGLGAGSGSDFISKAPDGRDWQSIMMPQQTPNQRVTDAFGAMPNDMQPVDRINDAFKALQGHGNLVPANMPGVHGPDAVMVAPPQRHYAGVDIPDKVRPAPVEDPEPSSIGFFLRNALAQRDRESGDYLNPSVGEQAMSSPFKGLFG